MSEEGEGVPPALLRAAVLGEGHLPVHGPGQRALGSWKPHFGSCCSFSLSDQPSLALSFPTLPSAEMHQDAVGLFCYTKQVYSASTATSICASLNFFPPFFCHAVLIQIPQRGEQGILYFKISSADFEKLSLNIL